MSNVNVKVVVRIRPQNKIETSRGGAPCVKVNDNDTGQGTEVNVEDGYNSQKWTFDCVRNLSLLWTIVFLILTDL